jgi:hypothetical protein
MTIVLIEGKAYALGEEIQFKLVPGVDNLTAAEKRCIERGDHIYAIKSVRERTGLGLRESKDLCDHYKERALPVPA